MPLLKWSQGWRAGLAHGVPGLGQADAQCACKALVGVVLARKPAQATHPSVEICPAVRERREKGPQNGPVSAVCLFDDLQRVPQSLCVRVRGAVVGYFPAAGSRSTWITFGAYLCIEPVA